MARTPTVLVTGATGALAGPVASCFLAGGWRVARLARRPPPDTVQATTPDPVDDRWYEADLTHPDATAAAVAEVERDLGGIDAVAHLAGGFARTAAAETRLEDLQDMLARNLVTVATVTTAVLPGMLRRGGGTLLGIAAAAARDGGAHAAPYAASKAALAAYLRAVDAEVAPMGVRTVVVYPMAAIDSPENRSAMPGADTSRWIDPDTFARLIVHAVAPGPRGRIRELVVHPDT